MKERRKEGRKSRSGRKGGDKESGGGEGKRMRMRKEV